MANRRPLPAWWFGYLLPLLTLSGVFVKVLLIEHQIVPKEFTAPRNGQWTLLALLALLALPLVRLGGSRRVAGAWAINAIGTVLALFEIWHFRFYGDLISVAQVTALSQLPMVASSVQALTRPSDWLYFADLAGLAVAVVLLRRRVLPAPPVKLMPAIVATGTVVLISAAATLPNVWGDPDHLMLDEFQRTEVAGSLGLAGYHAFDLFQHVTYPIAGRLQAAEHRDEVTTLLDAARRERTRSPIAGAARGRNVILISAESLQTFALDLEHEGQPLTPALRAFANESLFFTQFFDQAHLGTTSDAEFAALNSLMPLASGPVATRYEANDFRTLAHELGARGYHTISACGEPPAFWNMRQIHARYGFDRSIYLDSLSLTEWVGAGLDDASFFTQVVPTLPAGGSPFFSFMLTSAHHHPYTLPDHHRTWTAAPWPGTMAGDYIQSVQYFDRSFATLIETLKSTGLYDQSMIVVYGDHEAFLDESDLQRIWQTLGHKEMAGALDLWRLQKRVPLLIRLPHGELAGPRDVPGGAVDIAPTVLSLLGVDDVPATWLGHDLTAPAPRAITFHDGSATSGDVTSLVTKWRSRACFARDDTAIPCRFDADLRRRGDQKISLSRHIIEGNLIPDLTAYFEKTPGVAARQLGPVTTIAHRAGPSDFPENTLAAIRGALAVGVDMIEVDVQVTRDGVPVLFHDDTLDRTTNGHGPIAELALEDLKRLDAGAWRDHKYRGERVPTLDEAMTLIGGRAGLYLDVKAEGLARPTAALFRKHGIPFERVLLGIWTDRQRRDFLTEMPGARLVMVSEAPLQREPGFFRDLRARGYWGVEFGQQWPANFIGEALLAGFHILGYDVADEQTIRALRERGVTGIESDDPAMLLRTLRREP